MAEKAKVTSSGIISAILLVLALGFIIFGYYGIYMVEAKSAFQQQVQALWMLQYLCGAIILLLIAILVKLK
jgi:hypothetical protein